MDRHIVQNRIGYLLVELWNWKERGEKGEERRKREWEEKEEDREREKGLGELEREQREARWREEGRGCREWAWLISYS